MIKNPFEDFIKAFFDVLVLIDQSQLLVEGSLKSSVSNFEKLIIDKKAFLLASSLIIGDWTGPNDKGWKINYPTGSNRIIRLEDYNAEVTRLVNLECSYLFAQAFERLESLLKDFISYYASIDRSFCERCRFEPNKDFQFYRSLKYKRDDLLKYAKRIFKEKHSVKEKSISINFKEWWAVFAACRDATVHSGNAIRRKEISTWSNYHYEILSDLFPKTNSDVTNFYLYMERTDFSRGLIKIAEFGFQVFKQISIKHNYEWKILKNYGIIPSEARKARENQRGQNEISG